MFSRKKIAAVTALLGGLAVTGAVAPQTYAADTKGHCSRGVPGSKVCAHKSETVYTTKGGKVVVKQSQKCSTDSRQRVEWPEAGLLNRGTTKIGPEMNCSNKVPPIKGFKRPHIEL
ncbi:MULTISPECIES: hypothetical protein [unclassified Streptomyces]|uniref:hypothetical protein n=1 Tax=unclassified Streptomyces TaxID=2593676 RepID=UPI0038180DD3